MTDSRWPDGHDPAARALAAALEDARERGPDDVSLRRGWSAIADLPERGTPARARRWSYFAGGVATAAALTFACAALLWPRSTETSREASRRESGAPSSPIAAGDPGVRRLTLEGGVEAKLNAAGVLRLDRGNPRVEGGEVRFSVPHRPPGRPFMVRAESYWVVVVGTRFGVVVDGDRNVAIDVDEGVVEVWGRSADGKGKAGRLARLVPGDSWHSPVLAAAETAADDEVPAPAPVERTAAAPNERPARHTARASGRSLALATPGGGDGARADAPSESPPPAGDPAAIARSALASGDAARALQLYRALAQKSGPAAENAAYEVGKILGDKMGQPAAAVAAWRRYRSEYPQGLLRIEADVSIIETLARTGETDEALTEAGDFLRRHPESERRAEIARVAGDLYRARGDCRRAVVAYQIAVGGARARDVAETASFHRAECLVRLGDGAGADAARAYLRAYPAGRFRSEATALVAEDGRSR